MQNTIDLGFKRPDYGAVMPAEPPKEPETKVFYPSISIQDKPALAKVLKVGDEITATVKFKVIEKTERGESSQLYGGEESCRVELEALQISFDGIKVDDEDEEENGSSALNKFLSKKKPKADSYEE